MIKDLLLFSSVVIPYYLFSNEISGLYFAGLLLEKALKDFKSNSNSSSHLNLETYLFCSVYSILGISCVSFIGTLFNVDIISSAVSAITGLAISLISDLIEYSLSKNTGKIRAKAY